MERIDPPPTEFRLAELLTALSLVTDLGMGQPPETTMRACLIATGLARRRGLSEPEVSHVYFTTLLRYLGCTSFAHEEGLAFGGDDMALRSRGALVDFGDPRETFRFLLLEPGRGLPLPGRVLAVTRGFLMGPEFGRQLAASHCEVAARLAGRLGLPEEVQEGLFQLMEQWDGKGGPQGLTGEETCLPARYALLATRITHFANLLDPASADFLLRSWSGTLFDPELVTAFLDWRGEVEAETEGADALDMVLAAEPEPKVTLPTGRLREVAEALGDLADLKVPYLRGHSRGVARLAHDAAKELGLEETVAEGLRQAGLVHDIGRVGVINGVWEKPSAPSAGEWEQIRLHSYHGERILSRVPALCHLAAATGAHHERLDGSGYHRQVKAADQPLPCRILAAADVYQALTSHRPYRSAFEPAEAAAELRQEAQAGRLDPEAVNALLAAAGFEGAPVRREWPAGLSDREVEVLRLLARGEPNKRIARRLEISPKTVGHHVQHIYDKLDVSTRAAAALFAMEEGLLH